MAPPPVAPHPLPPSGDVSSRSRAHHERDAFRRRRRRLLFCLLVISPSAPSPSSQGPACLLLARRPSCMTRARAARTPRHSGINSPGLHCVVWLRLHLAFHWHRLALALRLPCHGCACAYPNHDVLPLDGDVGHTDIVTYEQSIDIAREKKEDYRQTDQPKSADI